MSFAVENLVVRYGAQPALDDVSLTFESGALGLLGPNGAGKSSLLRTLLGFVRPAAGRVSILGMDAVTHALALRRRIGYVPEDDALLPGHNGVAAVALCGELSGLRRPDALQRAHDVLHGVGLGEVRYRPVEEYSQGMRQRLKLAQAIVHDPELLILDEPTNGLDPRGRQEVLALIGEVRRKGMHLILSSHLLPDVEAVCDSVAVLESGRLVRQGRLHDLLRSRIASYEVRVKGPLEGFMAAVLNHGAAIREAPGGTFVIEARAEQGTDWIFASALRHGCQVRQFGPARATLTEVFRDAVDGGGAAHAHP
jgi:ABC-2 type transport system ATP-binding protein